MLSVKQGAASSTIFWVFGMTQPEIETRPRRPWADTLLIKPMTQYKQV